MVTTFPLPRITDRSDALWRAQRPPSPAHRSILPTWRVYRGCSVEIYAEPPAFNLAHLEMYAMRQSLEFHAQQLKQEALRSSHVKAKQRKVGHSSLIKPLAIVSSHILSSITRFLSSVSRSASEVGTAREIQVRGSRHGCHQFSTISTASSCPCAGVCGCTDRLYRSQRQRSNWLR